MRCPSCGGEDRKPVVAGYFECSSLVEVIQYGRALDTLRPGYTVPIDEVRLSVCGMRYHDTPADEDPLLCIDGFRAVALCRRCQTPVCLTCGVLDASRRYRYCPEHLTTPVASH